MDVMELCLIALALSLDAALYAFSYGLLLKVGRWRAALRLALVAALFQGLMPLVGYFCALPLRDLIAGGASVFLLVVFCGLGANMIYNAFAAKKEEAPLALGFASVLMVGLLTSIDALLLGGCMSISPLAGVLCFALLLRACAIIAAITFVMVLLFFSASSLFHRLPTCMLECLAGLILIMLGVSYAF